MGADGQLGLTCGCGKIGATFPFRKIEKLRGKGKGGLPGFPAGFFCGSLVEKFNHIHGATGGEGKSRFVGFVEGFQILGFGFWWGHF